METPSPMIPSGAPTLPSPDDMMENARSASEGFFASKWFRYGLLILILAILGFNLFNYLGSATDKVSSVVAPIVKPIASVVGDTVGEATKQTVNVAAKGASAAINKTADLATGGIDQLQGALHSRNTNIPPVPAGTRDAPSANSSAHDDSIKKAVAHAKNAPKGPEPDQSSSETQSRKHEGGFCYIGTDRGFRTCAEISEGEVCMSGDVFPTKDVCVNPALRA